MNRRPRLPRLVPLVAAALTLSSTALAAGISKDECIDANARGQELRRDGKLAAAAALLRVCTNASCPQIVRRDCFTRLDELQKVQPTIVFEPKDGKGADVSGVSVLIDGGPEAVRIDGTAIPVDIGEHEFTFVRPGEPPVKRRFTLSEGARGRRERIDLVSAAEPVPQAARVDAREPALANAVEPTHDAAPPSAARSPIGGQALLGIVTGAVGIAGLGVGTVFGALTFSERSSQVNNCSSVGNCGNRTQAASAHSSAETDATISTVGFVAGGALVAAAAVILLTNKKHTEEKPAVSMVLSPTFGPSSGGMLLRGEF